MQEIVRAAGLLGFRRLVRQMGGDPSDLLERVSLDDSMLSDPDRYIPYRNVLMVFDVAAEALGVSDFGLRLAAQQDTSILGTLALAIQTAPSLRQALIAVSNHINYHTPAIDYRIGAANMDGLEEVRLDFLVKLLPPVPQATEHAVSHSYKIVKLLSNGGIEPESIHFRHPQMSSDDRYREFLGQVPVFDSDFNGMRMRSAEFRRPIQGNNGQLQIFIERFLIGISPSADICLPDRVRDALRKLMQVQPASLQDVALVLRLHPRTLQRRLKEEGLRFDEIQDEIRREQIEKLLMQPNLPLATIARNVGYTEQATFNRACRRWYGTTPRALRQTLVQTKVVEPKVS